MTGTTTGRVFALIPAAGLSRRMGQPKLLLSLEGESVIRRLVTVLTLGGIDTVFVLVRQDDSNLQKELEALPCKVVISADDPPEMRDSVERLIEHVTQAEHPDSNARWLLIPADHPFVELVTIRQLLAVSRNFPEKIVLPTLHGKRGHPTLFPWAIAHEVHEIPQNKGLNWLVRRESARVIEVPVTQESVLFDLDTPDDLERAVKLVNSGW